MNCSEVRPLIDGYVDGELDLVRSVEVESHVEDCGACHEAVESRRAVKQAIRAADVRFKSPRGLEKRALAAVKEEARAENRRDRPPARRWPWAVGLAGFALAAVLAGSALRFGSRTTAHDLLVQEAVASHVRSLQASHLFDVASTDQHTVKPWFLGKLDYSPPVVDLADRGFPLTGGRLDYLDNRPVAALVYRRRLHVINLFVWPTSGDIAKAAETIRGYHALHWSQGGMTFYAVSDVNSGDLDLFTRELIARIPR